MSYYKPKALAIVSIFTSLISGTGMPILGLFMCEIQFIIMIGIDKPNFTEERDRIISLYLIYVVVIGFVSFTQRFVFSITGENLTCQIRYELFESLIHK